MEVGWMENTKVMVSLTGRMVLAMKGTMREGSNMVKENWFIHQEIIMKESGERASKMEKEYYVIPKEIVFNRAYGKKENLLIKIKTDSEHYFRYKI